MIKVIKFMEKAWLLIAILTFGIAIYQSIRNSVYDALYFFIFSIVATFLFLARRKQRMFHERQEKKKTD